MSPLRRPLLVVAVLAIVGGVVFVAKKAHASRELERARARILELGVKLDDLAARREEVAALRSVTGSEQSLAGDERAVLARALSRTRLPDVMDRLRAVAKRHALGPFEPARAVRQMPPFTRTPRLAKVDFQVEVATDWARLGALLGEVRALDPRVVVEETTVHRAEEVPLLAVRIVVSALVTDTGDATELASVEGVRFNGASPFFLASELASGKSRRQSVAPWTPPRVELEGIVYAEHASQVIVNGEPVSEGQSFSAGSDSVKVIEVSVAGARFQVGERIFALDLPPLSNKGAPR